ncbi:MAG: toll/interleukin-1 receptor domain-containing protein, partial [Bacteroidales bacterium]|nr:toll/interleukin-1 receptor domain-containing protein [Bacteroidales bacterium]
MAKNYLNSDNPVYFTYSRNSNEKAEWKSIADVVDDLLKTFRKENIKYSVDKEDIKVGDKISAYEHEIGDAKYVIIILSDRYFYRYHCMFELSNILKNTEGKTIKYIKSGNFNIQSLEYRKKIKDYWVQQKALIENRIATYINPDISLLEQSAIDNGFYLDFIDRLSKLFRDVSYENADNIRLGLLGSNPRHTQFVDEIKRDFGWRPSEPIPAPKSKFNEKYIFYAIMAVMLGVIIWLSNRTPNPIGEDMQRERDSIAKADEEKRRQDSIALANAAKAAEEKRRQDSIASANAAKAAEEARIAEQKRIKDSIASAEAKKNSTTQPISGTASGHPYVDLGLPSGTLWATCNVGADNPWDYGDYFAWGEISTESTYSWSNYK